MQVDLVRVLCRLNVDAAEAAEQKIHYGPAGNMVLAIHFL